MYNLIKENDVICVEHYGKVYKVGDKISSYVKEIDEANRVSKFDVSGTIVYFTSNLVGIKLKSGVLEAFQLHEIFHIKNEEKTNIPIQPAEYYSEQIIKECIDNLNKNKEGYVFNETQLEVIQSQIEGLKYCIKDNIYMISKEV